MVWFFLITTHGHLLRLGFRANHLCGKVHKVTAEVGGVDQNITGTAVAWHTVVLALQTWLDILGVFFRGGYMQCISFCEAELSVGGFRVSTPLWWLEWGLPWWCSSYGERSGRFSSTAVPEHCGIGKAMLVLVQVHVCACYVSWQRKYRSWSFHVERPCWRPWRAHTNKRGRHGSSPLKAQVWFW